jgi:hypothetical protein
MEVKDKNGVPLKPGDTARYQHYDEQDRDLRFESGRIQKFTVRFENGDEGDLDTVTKVTSGGTRRRSRGTRRRRR